jgi:hypothetical protein
MVHRKGEVNKRHNKLNRNADLQVGLQNKRAEQREALLIDSLSSWERVLPG